MKPMRVGSTPNSVARLRTRRMARWASGIALPATVYFEPGSRARRYFKMNAAIPCAFSQSAISYPSTSHRQKRVPAPRSNNHRRPIALSLRRKKRNQRKACGSEKAECTGAPRPAVSPVLQRWQFQNPVHRSATKQWFVHAAHRPPPCTIETDKTAVTSSAPAEKKRLMLHSHEISGGPHLEIISRVYSTRAHHENSLPDTPCRTVCPGLLRPGPRPNGSRRTL